MGSLLASQTGGISAGGGGGNVFQVGVQFVVAEAVEVDRIAYYNVQNNADNAPLTLKLWNMSVGPELLHSVPAVNSGAVIGWYESPLSAPYTLQTGVTYAVTGFFSGDQWGEIASANVVAPDAPFQFAANRRCWNNGNDAPPNEFSNANLITVDILASESGGGGGDPGEEGDPPTNANLSVRLGQWLSSDPGTQTHELDGLPWLTKVVVDSVQVGVDEAVGMLEALIALGIAVRFNDAEAIMTALRAVVDEIALDTQATRAYTTAEGVSGFSPLMDDIKDAIEAGPTDLRAPQDTVPLGAAGWTAVDTVLGQGAFLWDVPADRYLLTITAYGAKRMYQEVGGVPYWLHRGFWAPVNFDMVGHFYPLAGHKHELYEVGRRLPGVLLALDGDLEWTLTAYDYTGAA